MKNCVLKSHLSPAKMFCFLSISECSVKYPETQRRGLKIVPICFTFMCEIFLLILIKGFFWSNAYGASYHCRMGLFWPICKDSHTKYEFDVRCTVVSGQHMNINGVSRLNIFVWWLGRHKIKNFFPTRSTHAFCHNLVV